MDRSELEKMTVVQLREKASEYEDIKGVSGMKKEDLVAAVAEKLGIDLHEHVPTGIGRHDLKAHIRKTKKARDAALQAGDREAYLQARRRLKHYRRKLRRVISQAVEAEHHKPSAEA
jgi:hypothetical protein